VLVAGLRGIGDDKIATIIAGQRPGGSHARRSRRLRLGRVLPELTYQQAVDQFGEEGTAEFIYLVELYCMVSVTLNGSDVHEHTIMRGYSARSDQARYLSSLKSGFRFAKGLGAAGVCIACIAIAGLCVTF
jgi:hypothetical protein